MEKWIDSHCHYECDKFKRNRKEIIEKVSSCCEKVICVGTNIKENLGVISLSESYDFIYNMVGFFPTSVYLLDKSYCSDAQKNIAILKEQLCHRKNVGLGEIGLDYSWNSCGDLKGDDARLLQQKWFREQILIAKEYDKPISIHSRDAEEDTIKILNEFGSVAGVIHCFSYGVDAAKFFVNKGLYLGIGGTSTYKNNQNIRDAIEITPIEKILLETDAPYLSPEPVRRTVNDSSNITYVIDLISQIKDIPRKEVIDITNNNCQELYKF